MAVDRQSPKVFASRGNLIYKSEESGKTGSWQKQYHFSEEHIHSMFYTKEGSLLVVTSKGKLLRSTDDGRTFNTVLTDVVRWRAFDSIYQDSKSGTIIFGEYPSTPSSDDEIRLLRSTDDGKTWTKTFSRTGKDIRHWHSVQVDPYTGKWIATSGDFDHQVEWWKSIDDGES